MGIHPSILAWEIPWTEEPGGLNLWGCKSKRVGHNLGTKKNQQLGFITYIEIKCKTLCFRKPSKPLMHGNSGDRIQF